MTNNHKAAMEAMLADFDANPHRRDIAINPEWLRDTLRACNEADAQGVRLNPEWVVADGEFVFAGQTSRPTAKYLLVA
jgi:hypothetical protein